MVRTDLVPTIMSLRLLSPRLLIAKFRGAQRNLTVYVAHAPHSDASPADREDFYTTFSAALSDRNEMDTRIVLMDANTGPGEWRHGRSHIVGPHGIPYAKKDLDKDDNHFQFNHFCWSHNLCVGHTWFRHKESQKLTFYPNSPHSGQPRDMDHILIDGRSSSFLGGCPFASRAHDFHPRNARERNSTWSPNGNRQNPLSITQA